MKTYQIMPEKTVAANVESAGVWKLREVEAGTVATLQLKYIASPA